MTEVSAHSLSGHDYKFGDTNLFFSLSHFFLFSSLNLAKVFLDTFFISWLVKPRESTIERKIPFEVV